MTAMTVMMVMVVLLLLLLLVLMLVVVVVVSGEAAEITRSQGVAEVFPVVVRGAGVAGVRGRRPLGPPAVAAGEDVLDAFVGG